MIVLFSARVVVSWNTAATDAMVLRPLELLGLSPTVIPALDCSQPGSHGHCKNDQGQDSYPGHRHCDADDTALGQCGDDRVDIFHSYLL
jgi:hypothetical protein